MTKTLLFKLVAEPATTYYFSYWHDARVMHTGHTDNLKTLVKYAEGAQVVALLPADQVAVLTVPVPAGQIKHLPKILPALLEDHLASDIESLHFAIIDLDQQHQATVAVVAKTIMQHWQQRFAEVGLVVNAIIPETYLLPWQAGSITASIVGDIAFIRHSATYASMCDVENLNTLLSINSAHSTQLTSIDLYADAFDNADQRVSFDYSVHYQGKPIDPLTQRPDAAALKANLLQGEFRSQHHFSKVWLAWRPLALLGCLGLLFYFINVALETRELRQQADHYQAQIEARFRQVLPNEKRIVNIKAQMSQYLQNMQSHKQGFAFLDLLNQLLPALEQVKRLSLTRMQFDQAKGELVLALSAEDYQQIEQLVTLTKAHDLNVSLGEVSGNSGAYQATIQIKANHHE